MRDGTKVVIGLGSIWGLFAMGATLLSSFTMGSNDTAPEVVAVILYGLTILPSCIFGIWFQRKAAVWLVTLACVSLFGLGYQVAVQGPAFKSLTELLKNSFEAIVLSLIPGLIGFLLLRSALLPRKAKNLTDWKQLWREYKQRKLEA